jgi:nucleolar protein 56
MEIYITSSIAGFIAFDEKLNIIDYNLFKEDDIPLNFVKIGNSEILTEEIDLIRGLIKNNDNIIIESNIRLSNYISYFDTEYKDKIHIQTPNRGGNYLRSNLEDVLCEIGFFGSEELDNSKRLDNNSKRINNKSKLISIYNKIAIFKMKESSKEEDKLVIQAINSIDEIDESISKLIERIREWNVIYFPEIDIIQNNESFINLIADNDREKIIEFPPDIILKNNEIDIENGSSGADIEVEDIEMINNFAKSIQSLQKTRNKTEEYIDKKMEKLAPNLRDLLGSSLAAKLIAHIRGIKNLSMYSASTIQIMGAEKALFRHLKTGERPPKHGLIFQHPQVRTSNWWIRGKIARTLALKISLAVRKDVFSGEFDPNISEGFLERVEEIKKDNPFPKKTTKRRKEERNFEKGKKSKSYKKTKKERKKKFKNKKRKKK